MEKMIKFSRIGFGFSRVLKIMAWVGCGLLLASLVFIVCTKDTSGLIYRDDHMHVSVYAPVALGNYSLAQAIPQFPLQLQVLCSLDSFCVNSSAYSLA